MSRKEILPLERLFQNRSIAKTLDFLSLYHTYDYSKTDISREAGVEWKTLLNRVIPTLEKYDLIQQTRTIGRAQLYRANMENPLMKIIRQLQIEIATHDNQKHQIPIPAT